MAQTLVLFGPPGSGKGTQAARLRDDLGFRQLATGDLLREARAAGTELGQRAGEYMDRGDLVPDDVILEMVRDAIERAGDEPIVLDGFPRSVAQADALADALDGQDRELSAAVLIDVPDDVVVERISGRGQGRSDDNPETVRERLPSMSRSAGQPSIGDGGIRVSPWTRGIRIATSSSKHHDQSSPGSSERMIGWPVSRACALA
jgi:adenylate kinase